MIKRLESYCERFDECYFKSLFEIGNITDQIYVYENCMNKGGFCSMSGLSDIEFKVLERDLKKKWDK